MDTQIISTAKDNSPIRLKCIDELLQEKHFFIPDFQRGYRWTTEQVEAFMNDIWKFRNDSQNSNKEVFYCLQPLVVSKGEHGWMLIDGQQRLTTIHLILSHLKLYMNEAGNDSFVLKYQTRQDSEDFLNNPTEEKALDCPDYYHMYEAYKSIGQWFAAKGGTAKGNFFNTLMNSNDVGKNVKVIWYEVSSQSFDEHINIFTRLNIGKIPLTNAELIKALLLQKGNFSQESATLRQIQIATEWDIIEKRLQENDFWHFIYQERGLGPYENRIEFIFDLMYKRSKESDGYYTFIELSKEAARLRNKSGKMDVDQLWLDIKQCYQTFVEWYSDRDYYHLIGFLAAYGESISELREATKSKTKSEFKAYLKQRIQEYVNFDVRELDYSNSSDRKNIKKALLLFNIHTLMATKEADSRFPFYRYKTNGWDIEHIRSQKDKEIKNDAQRHEWLGDLFNYFTGRAMDDCKGLPVEVLGSLNLKSDVLSFCQRALELSKMEQPEQNSFSVLREEIEMYFGEQCNEGDKDEELNNSIGNLALLDETINRSYKNALFPIKRKKIIEYDEGGKFIPICTKNVFLKYYTNRFDEIMHWKAADVQAYESAIYNALKEYTNY